MQKWEYQYVLMSIVSDEARLAQLNGLGDMGWELVAVTTAYAFFKRPK